MKQIFNAISDAIVATCGVVTQTAQGTEHLASSYSKLCQVADTNAERVLDEAKHLNTMRREEMKFKLEHKFKVESESWQDNV